MLIVTTTVSTNGGPFIPDNKLSYLIPDTAQEMLDPILSPCERAPEWLFEQINFGRPPAPWAVACLDREYALAGHIATVRACLRRGFPG